MSTLEGAKGIRLDIGCGKHKHELAFGVDKVAYEGVDLVHDLTTFPWPLPDDIAHSVFMIHVWQEIPRAFIIPFMEELYRVSKNGAEIFLAGYYGMDFRFLADPRCVNPMMEHTLAYWDPRGDYYQCFEPKARFELKHWSRVAAGRGSDYNAVLKVIKEG